ncbi:Lysophospholipase L1 [Paenibacillaceae bacterium GAS479]|nr:Lysophospholipase L1 [Paenibacillaceae bacterium GAS479]
MMLYVALGDSITFGESASSWARAYPQLSTAALNARRYPTRGAVIARSGWSSADLLNSIEGPGRNLIRQAEVITVWIGGIDVANYALEAYRNQQPIELGPVLADYSQNYSSILSYIRANSRARIVCCTQYNPFPNSPIAVTGIQLLNSTTDLVARRFGAVTAPVHSWFEGRQQNLIYGYQNGIIEDALNGFFPIHPNNRGHQVIARGLFPFLTPRRSR